MAGKDLNIILATDDKQTQDAFKRLQDSLGKANKSNLDKLKSSFVAVGKAVDHGITRVAALGKGLAALVTAPISALGGMISKGISAIGNAILAGSLVEQLGGALATVVGSAAGGAIGSIFLSPAIGAAIGGAVGGILDGIVGKALRNAFEDMQERVNLKASITASGESVDALLPHIDALETRFAKAAGITGAEFDKALMILRDRGIKSTSDAMAMMPIVLMKASKYFQGDMTAAVNAVTKALDGNAKAALSIGLPLSKNTDKLAAWRENLHKLVADASNLRGQFDMFDIDPIRMATRAIDEILGGLGRSIIASNKEAFTWITDFFNGLWNSSKGQQTLQPILDGINQVVTFSMVKIREYAEVLLEYFSGDYMKKINWGDTWVALKDILSNWVTLVWDVFQTIIKLLGAEIHNALQKMKPQAMQKMITPVGAEEAAKVESDLAQKRKELVDIQAKHTTPQGDLVFSYDSQTGKNNWSDGGEKAKYDKLVTEIEFLKDRKEYTTAMPDLGNKIKQFGTNVIGNSGKLADALQLTSAAENAKKKLSLAEQIANEGKAGREQAQREIVASVGNALNIKPQEQVQSAIDAEKLDKSVEAMDTDGTSQNRRPVIVHNNLQFQDRSRYNSAMRQ